MVFSLYVFRPRLCRKFSSPDCVLHYLPTSHSLVTSPNNVLRKVQLLKLLVSSTSNNRVSIGIYAMLYRKHFKVMRTDWWTDGQTDDRYEWIDGCMDTVCPTYFREHATAQQSRVVNEASGIAPLSLTVG
jgi:hypothetical protein